MRKPGAKALASTALLLLAALFLFELTPLDLVLQDKFYSPETGQWLVDRNSPMPKFFLYKLPKYLLALFGVFLLANSLGRLRCRWWGRLESCYIIACLVLIPSAVALLKEITGICCPSELTRYGGIHAHQTLFETLRAGGYADCDCYPAGHASGGFALLCLYWTTQDKRVALPRLSIGLIVGSAMGLYQMMKGAHFLSHTVVTALLAWLIAQALAQCACRIAGPPNPGESPNP